VSQDINPMYHDLISKSGGEIGMLVLPNTRLNVVQYAAFPPPGSMRWRRIAA
jgi:predicted NodU family carbamoyl transferase